MPVFRAPPCVTLGRALEDSRLPLTKDRKTEIIESYRTHCTVIQKIRTRAAMKTLFAELENYAGSELDADYS